MGRRTRGTVLIAAMWIVLVLAGLVLVFARVSRVEVAATANHVAELQAANIAQGALAFVLSEVNGTGGAYATGGDASFEAVPVGEGFFWIVDPSWEDDRAYSFGVRGESSRLNLNSATRDMLLKLPGMTAELAASIVDWRDADSEVSPGGAESEYYLLLSDPYDCKSAPFEAVEELLLVRGASPALLWGEDLNRNGVLDPNENDASESEPPDNRDGRLDRGLFDFLTVYSREPNQTSSGENRVNVNDASGGRLSDVLRGVVGEDRFFQVMERVRGGRPFRNVLDFYFRTGLTSEEFARIADRLTTSGARELVGLVNVNTAPREVLLCLPGLEESDVDALLAKRSASGTDLSSMAWVAQVLSREKAVEAGGFMTVRSYQFSADIVAVSGNGRAFRRYRAVVDARTSPPRVLYWKDLTHLGWPLASEILTALRSGGVPADAQTLAGGGR
ncbi:MAG: type II secretion system protein GspK [Planctomycetota bacterium]